MDKGLPSLYRGRFLDLPWALQGATSKTAYLLAQGFAEELDGYDLIRFCYE